MVIKLTVTYGETRKDDEWPHKTLKTVRRIKNRMHVSEACFLTYVQSRLEFRPIALCPSAPQV